VPLLLPFNHLYHPSPISTETKEAYSLRFVCRKNAKHTIQLSVFSTSLFSIYYLNMSDPSSNVDDFVLEAIPAIDVGAVTASSTIPASLLEPPLGDDALASIPTTLPSTVVSKPPAMPPPQQAAVPPASLTTAKKSKKKKQQVAPQVTMATTSGSSGSQGAQGENTGRWTAEEHRLFLQGLDQHGKGWKKIASLIKSRTVVQIRTHAQKYFQKLAKARQNGEEGDVSMEGRGGPAAVTTATTSAVHTTKRRRQTTGTKRKAISSVVSSAERQGKRLATAQAAAGIANPTPPLPAVAPALAPFVPPTTIPSITTAHGTISGPALEDSLFRFLTPAPIAGPADPAQVNEVARQAGANPITVPADKSSASPADSGEISPTGVNDLAMYPSWADVKDMPSWYAKGADVDCLLDVADTLDWLTDTGDINETYDPPKVLDSAPTDQNVNKNSSLSTDALAAMDSDAPVAALPSLFENAEPSKKQDSSIEDHLNVFDTPMEEHAFVSALLENNGESSGSLPVIS
jgi:SHAQKYF class myb-like DNA-binding protein